jgi:hypothetical protein
MTGSAGRFGNGNESLSKDWIHHCPLRYKTGCLNNEKQRIRAITDHTDDCASGVLLHCLMYKWQWRMSISRTALMPTLDLAFALQQRSNRHVGSGIFGGYFSCSCCMGW